MKRLFAVGLLIVLSAIANSGEQARRAYYIAVYSDATVMAVGTVNKNGLFVRYEDDTAWVNVRPNVYTFGVGYAEHGNARQHYIAGGNGLHRSTDGGRTWRVLTGWETKEILSVALDSVEPSILYISTPFGVFKSTDGGARWVETMNGFKTTYTKQIVLDRTNHSRIYATAEDDLYISNDGGVNWKAASIGVPGIKCVAQHPVKRDMLYVGTEDGGLWYSVDRGHTWKQAIGFPQAAIYAIRASNDGKTLYAAGFQTGVWKSEDDGVTWRQIWSAPDIGAIYTIFVHPDHSDHIIVGTNGKGMFESVDGGNTWHQAGFPNAHIRQIELYSN